MIRPPRLVAFIYSDVPNLPRDVLVRGNVRDWLVEAGVPAQRSARLRGWLVRRETAPDLMAKAQRDGVLVRTRGDYAPPVPPTVPAPRPVVAPTSVDGQLALLEVGDVA